VQFDVKGRTCMKKKRGGNKKKMEKRKGRRSARESTQKIKRGKISTRK
jgi:hypothetical protein